jgi:hypothetical protein
VPRSQIVIALLLFAAGVALGLLTKSFIGVMAGISLALGGGAMLVRPNARYREREPDWPRWLEYMSRGKGDTGVGPEIFIGPGPTEEDDDPDRDQVKRDRGD